MSDFPENLVLENDRARLQPLQHQDVKRLVNFSLREPQIWQFYYSHMDSAEAMQDYIDSAVRQRQEKREYPFIVFDKASAEYAGSTRFYDVQLHNLATSIGYTWFGKTFQRTGLNRNCKLLMLSHAFETWGMERVEFRAHTKNLRSIEAMQAIGCTVEGILRSTSPCVNGERRDSIVLSILKHEWFGGIKEKLLDQIH